MSRVDDIVKRMKNNNSSGEVEEPSGSRTDRVIEKVKKSGYKPNSNLLDSLISDYNNFTKNATNDYASVNYHNSSKLGKHYEEESLNLRLKLEEVKALYNLNRSDLTEEELKLRKYISDATSNVGELGKLYSEASRFYSQFDSEDSYNKWYEDNKKIEEFNADRESGDYYKYSQIGASIDNPSYNKARIDKHNLWDWIFKKNIQNPVQFAIDNKEGLERSLSTVNSSSDYGVINQYYQYTFMEPEEVELYNYYLGKGNVDKANEYLASIQDTLNRRQSGQVVKNIGDSKALKIAFAVGAGLDQFASGIGNIDNYFTGAEADPTTVTQYASSEIRESLDGFWGGAYDVVSTTSNMLPSVLVGMVSGGAGLATMGVSAVGNSYAEMKNLGYTDWQARGYATLVGASEVLLQSALGGISKLGGKHSLNAGVKKLVSGFDNALAKLAIQVPLNMVSEGFEEALQTYLEPHFKAFVTGEEYESAEWEEIVYSGLLGALSAGLIEGGPALIGATGSAINDIKIKKAYSGDVDNLLIDAANIKDSGKKADKYINKYEKKGELSGSNIRNLLDMTDTNKVKSAVKGKLTSLGEKGDVSQLADIITKKVKGVELSRKEKKTLDSSTYGKRVVDGLDPEKIKSGEYETDWVKGIGTRALNANVYNKSAYDLINEAVREAEASAIKSSEEKKVIEAKYDAPAETKITIEKDGEKVEAKVDKIASLENGEMSIELEGGETVNVDEVDFGGSGIGLVYQAAKDMASRVGGFNIDTANVFVRGFNPESGQTAAEYIHGWSTAFNLGKLGTPVSALDSNAVTSKLSDKQKTNAYNFGKAFGKESVSNNESKIVNTVTKNDANISKTDSKKKKGKVHFDGSVSGKSLNERQRASLKGLRFLSNALGIDIYVFESQTNAEGKRIGENGWYDPSDHSIHIDLYAGAEAEALMLYTASHELTHHIREVLPEKFNILADAVHEEFVNAYGEAKFAELIANKKEFLKEKGRITEDMSEEQAYDLAYEEVVADCFETMLVDSNAIEALSKNIYAKDKTLWQKIKEFISKLVARITGAYKDVNPDSEEGNLLRALGDSAERLQKLWADALVEASEISSDIVEIDTNTESVAPIMYSERTWSASEYVTHRNQMAEKIAKALGVTKNKALSYINDINSIARIIANDRARLDYEASSFGSAFVSNVEYGGSFDYTTLCKKRRIYTGTFTEIQKRLNDVALTPEDILKIRNLMIEEGIEATCGLCYVEGSRANMGKFAKEFIKLYKRDNPLAWIPNMADVNTPDGVEKMRINHPEVYEQYEYFWNHYGKLKDSDPALFASQQKPKLYEARKEYKGEILEHFKDKTAIEKKNRNGGIRMQSFSDFEIVHLIDTMQVIMDMSTVGLAGQAYTKVPEFAKAFGNTGLKINLSLIAKGVDADGNLIFDDREGMPHETAFELRDRYSKNVGTIIVTFTDEQLLAAMADPRIDFIIPFHRSQWKKGQYGAMGLPKGTKDYTYMQNEKLIKKTYHEYRGRMVLDKASNYMPNEYWDFSKSGKENAEAYLKMCAENNKRPKFYKLLDYDGKGTYSLKADGSTDGYWKLLIDFKMYDNNGVASPQEAVTPTFNMDEAKTMLDEYQGGHAKYPVASSVVDKFVDEYNKANKTKYSDRASQKVTYSDRDSLGNELSKEQQEYFKDSKARDKNGNLMVLYHGTTANFNTFKKGDVGFHFGTKGAARGRVGFGKNAVLKEVYLNVTNPIVFDEDLGSWDADFRLTRELYDKGILTQAEAESVLFTDDRQYKRATEAANKKLASVLLEKGYDGIAYSNTFETKNPTTSYIVFNSNQAKEIANKIPTSNPDIRYSFRNSKSGMANDSLSPYNEELTKFIRQNGGYIVDSYDKLIQVVNHAFDNPNLKATAYFGIINTDTLEKIKNSIPNLPQSSKDILFKKDKDYSIATTLDAIRHIVDDKNLNREDVIDYLDRLADTILEFDTVNFDYYNQGSSKTPGLLFNKRFDDGTLVSFALVSHKKRSLVLQSLYLNSADYKKKKGAETLLMQNASAHTPETQVGQPSINSLSQSPNSVKRKFSDRSSKKASYAPTFYSHMGNVIDGIRIEKMGAGGVVPYLKGKGVKDEEIKWSGIEVFLEGKKSVTKVELQEFVAGSQLQIEEEMSNPETYEVVLEGKDYIVKDKSTGYALSTWKHGESFGQECWTDEDGNTAFSATDIAIFAEEEGYGDSSTRWSQYKLDGGTNYRELVFKMPNSTYSNRAMRGHWGQDAEGILVHARIQDFDVDGKKMLFIEELQSDWHNEGHEKGYSSKEYEDAYAVYEKLAEDYTNKRKAFNKYVRSSEFRSDPDDVSKKKFDWLRRKMDDAEKRMQQAERDIEALKEKGMGDVPDAPFRNNYHEYVLKRLLRMAAEEGYDSIGWTPADIQSDRWSDEFAEGYRIEYDQEMPKFLRKYGKKWGATVGKSSVNGDTEIWSMDITDSMKDSVLYEGQAMYQDRNPDSFSNRSLLANALETAAQNDIEREKLKQYKEKIDLINSEEQKLHEVREKIKELSFKKGPRDTEAIKSLQFEANQSANRINTYDRQLLNLESTKALKGVLEREKEQARKRAEQKGKEALARYREKATETQRELMTRYQESRKRGIESRNKTAMRHKIKEVVNDLNNYLLKGTKDKHVPIELQKAVAEALDAVNMDTVGAEERIAKKRAEMMSAKTPEAVEKLAKEIEHIQEMGGNMEAKISRLKTAYDSIINSTDPLVANSHDEVISNTIARVMEVVGDTPLRDMSLYQLEEVYDMYRMVLHSIRTANKAFKAKKSEEISVIANRVIEEIDNLGKKKVLHSKTSDAWSKFDWNNEKPVYAFERIGSGTFTDVFNNVRAGEDTWAVDMSEAQGFREEQYNKYKYESWDFKKRYQFTSSTGKNFELSLDQIMSLYAYSKRGDQAKDHLKNGGFVFDGLTEVKVKNKLGVTKTYQLKDATAYNLSDEILADIISKLTPEQKAFADAMQNYLSTTMGEKGNEVSLELYGVKLFKEKNYFPLKSAPQYLERAREQAQGDVKIKNKGFTKETVPKATNPIVLTSFMDVWAGHVNEMSMYHSFTLALEDFYRVFNYKTPASETMDSVGVIPFIENAHGNAAIAYIDQLLKDLNGGARSDPRETVAKALMSRFKKSAVMGSLSVVVQQPTSIIRAMALVDAKYFGIAPITRGVIRAFNRKSHKALWAEVKKYAPVAIIKEMGYFDTGMGQSSVEWLKGEKSFMDKVDDVLSKAPAIADELAWISIWNAVKKETAHNNPNLKTNSEEFLKLAGERFTEVIVKTQVYDSTLAKSSNMRSKSALMNMWTSFMAEPTTTINMVADAFRKGNKKYIARVLSATVGSIALNAALVSLIYAMRDDDEDETFIEKYLSRVTTEFVDGINPITYIPFVKDMWSILQGFDVERADMALITDLFDSIQSVVKVLGKDTSNMDEEELSKHQGEVAEALWGIVDSASSLGGIPEKNIRRDINGIINLFKTLGRDMDTSFGSLMDNIGEDLKDSVPVWGWLPDESKSDKLYDAIIKGDEAYVERMKSGYKSDSAYESAVRKALRENDPRINEAAQARYDGNISEYTRIAKEIIGEGKFSQDTVVGAINSAITDIKKSESTDTDSNEDKDEASSIYAASDINSALESGDTTLAKSIIDGLVKTKVANGKTEKEAKSSLRSSLTSYWKPLYKEAYSSGNSSEMARIRKILYSSGLYGTADEVVESCQNWLKD